MFKTPRYLVSFDTTQLPMLSTDVLVVGSGIAGLRAALRSSQYGRVMLLTKNELTESNTAYAQGGIATHLDSPNLVKSHIRDTLESGQGLSNPRVVRFIIQRGLKEVSNLIKWGIRFDRHGRGLHLAREGGHTRPRILHSGDKTGQEILRVLLQKVKQSNNINIRDHIFVTDILTSPNRRQSSALGVLAYHNNLKGFIVIQSLVTILASGGLGQIYRETTNSPVATGDGLAMAYRAGAELMDMEFIQFHPTALYVAGAVRALISEAVRGAGAKLVDKNGKRFMTDYHPAGELAPRDIVSRSIVSQMRKTNDTNVYLDITHLDSRQIAKQFPGLVQLCRNFGIRTDRDRIPVRPATHYTMGGIKTALDGSTNIKNLLAGGECACPGFHGANRLGSNSLLEGLVMGAVCGDTAGKIIQTSDVRRGKPIRIKYTKHHLKDSINLADVTQSLKSLMWRDVGIERQATRLKEATKMIEFWSKYILTKEFDSPAGWELQNMLHLAYLVTQSALARRETRGAHYRIDFSQTDKNWRKHITV